MSKKFYPIISIILFILIIAIGYVATSGILSTKNSTAKLSTESKSVLVSSSSQKSQENSTSSSSFTTKEQAISVPSSTSIENKADAAPVDDGWVRVEPLNPSSDVNQIRG